MERIGRRKIVEVVKGEDFGGMVNVKGWVGSGGGRKEVKFIGLNDGCSINNVEIVVELGKFDEDLVKLIRRGGCVRVNGEVVKWVGWGEGGEIEGGEIEVLGSCENSYGLEKKGD